MCCRYYTEMSPELRPIVEAAKKSKLYRDHIGTFARPVMEEGEISPGMLVSVLASSKSGKKTAYPMIWGYHVDGIARLIVNARTETAAEKKMFRESWLMHRCIIPACWYVEWDHRPTEDGKKEKYAIMPKGEETTWLCGLYRMEEGYPHFVVLTRQPGDSIAALHDRMPMILRKDDIGKWIDPQYNPHLLLPSALTDMVAEKIAS